MSVDRLQPPLGDHHAVKAAGARPKGVKGKGHDFPPHHHDEMVHSHGHSHITHYRVPGERDEWQHLTSTHEHEHNHAEVDHMHKPHDELGIEHVHEAHVHDHGHPSA